MHLQQSDLQRTVHHDLEPVAAECVIAVSNIDRWAVGHLVKRTAQQDPQDKCDKEGKHDHGGKLEEVGKGSKARGVSKHDGAAYNGPNTRDTKQIEAPQPLLQQVVVMMLNMLLQDTQLVLFHLAQCPLTAVLGRHDRDTCAMTHP